MSIKSTLRNKAWFNLSLVLMLVSFAILASVAVMCGVALAMAYRLGFIDRPVPLFGTVVLLVIFVIIGMIEAAIIFRKTLRTVSTINRAMNEVANGNFNVRINDEYFIDEMQSMAQSFNKMTHELQSTEMFRSDFIANVSHEFKTPLAAIEGYATLLQDDSLTALERDEYIRRITDTTRNLSEMTGNILYLSRIENQEITPQSVEFELDEQIREVILELEQAWTDKLIDLNIDLDPVKCVAPAQMLRHVWLNILHNAIKYTHEHGSVAVRLTSEGGRVIFSVSDTGIGMTSEVQQHIFEKFYKADKSRASHGNGLGLALTKRIVDICGGTVAVESIPDIGSTFIVSIPQEV